MAYGAVSRYPLMWYFQGSLWKAATGIPILSEPIYTVLDKMSMIRMSFFPNFSSATLRLKAATLPGGKV